MDHNLRFLVRFCALLLINLLSFCVCFNKQQESQTLTPGKSWGNDSPTPVTACPALPRLPPPHPGPQVANRLDPEFVFASNSLYLLLKTIPTQINV